MSEQKKTKKNKKTTMFPLGIVLLILGVSMILAWWPDVVSVFRGLLGIALALGGLLVLYSLNK
ncbi:MAG: hypothetical protein H6755_02485 [Candidatus Omnitrophica bacterium]|nr:hypothetical protein [Candidatus Omnitrophota bacterium]MCB9747255.1 hypothetical protein [Candidatus Omnitrophota bacterium]